MQIQHKTGLREWVKYMFSIIAFLATFLCMNRISMMTFPDIYPRAIDVFMESGAGFVSLPLSGSVSFSPAMESAFAVDDHDLSTIESSISVVPEPVVFGELSGLDIFRVPDKEIDESLPWVEESNVLSSTDESNVLSTTDVSKALISIEESNVLSYIDESYVLPCIDEPNVLLNAEIDEADVLAKREMDVILPFVSKEISKFKAEDW